MNGEIDRSKLSICLNDHDYQDWWVKVDLMTRISIPDGMGLQLVPGRHIGPETVRTLLIINTEFPRGYLIDDNDLMSKVGRFNTSNHQFKFNRKMERAKKALVDKKLLFRGYNIGWGMYIEFLKLSAAGIIVMYPMYQNMGQMVSVDQLANFAYPDGTENYAHKIWDHIDELRQKSLPGTKARIETPGLYHQVSGYRLYELQ